MFDFDAGKIIVIGVVALVVIGPKELPRVMRQVGQTVGKLRRMAGEFQAQFMEAMREAEMADVKEEMSKIAETAKIDVAFDPVRHIRNEIGNAISGETRPQDAVAEVINAPALPSDNMDLSAISPAQNVGTTDGAAPVAEAGLVATGIAPQPVEEPAIEATPAAAATLDDVREALSEKLDDERRPNLDAAHDALNEKLDRRFADREATAKEHTA